MQTTTSEPTVFVVDDDEAVRDSLRALLEVVGFTVETFDSGQKFLDAGVLSRRGCLLLDVRMPDIGGLDIQQKLAACGSNLPTIIITGHGDVPLAVKAMKAGAFDFIEKPFTDETILKSVQRAFEYNEQNRREVISSDDATDRIQQLTPRELEVLNQLVIGHQNKVIAYELGISPRTVEIHRARVMEKLQADSLSHLVRMALASGLKPTQG